jgi:hypothetical protein
MHPSAAAFLAMPPARRREVHLLLCEHALEVWEQHFPPGDPPSYVESVVGTRQVLDVGLPREALDAVRVGRDDANLDYRYREPIAALQDDDLEFPDAVEFAYYAIYNAFRRHVQGADLDDWLIVNQALASVGAEQTLPVLERCVETVARAAAADTGPATSAER